MHKKSHAEHAVAQEIHVLFRFNLIRRSGKQFLGFFMKIMSCHRSHISIAQITKAMSRCPFDEFVEITRCVIFFEVIMEKVIIRLLTQQFEFALKERAIGVVILGNRFHQEFEQATSLLQFLLGSFKSLDVIKHHVANHSTHTPTWQNIVADISNAIWSQVFLADLKNLFLHFFRNPRENTMHDDVIKHAILGPNVHDVGLAKFDILKA